jgi:hypothetical protein
MVATAAAPTVADTNAVAARFLAEAPAALRALIVSLHAQEIGAGMAARVLSGAAARKAWDAAKAAGRAAGIERYVVDGRFGSLAVLPAGRNSREVRVSYTSQTRAVWESR